MNLIRQIRTVIDAEIRREKLVAGRAGRRIALAAVGGFMLFLVSLLIQVAIIVALHGPAGIALIWSVLILTGGDLLLGILFLLLARGNAPKAVEIGAKLQRDQALQELRSAATLAALTGPVLRLGTTGLRSVLGFVLKGNRRRHPR